MVTGGVDVEETTSLWHRNEIHVASLEPRWAVATKHGWWFGSFMSIAPTGVMFKAYGHASISGYDAPSWGMKIQLYQPD